MPNPFTDHPASVGESYWEHMVAAAGFGLTLIAAGAACLLHAILPFAFPRTASRLVARLHARMAHRGKATRPGEPSRT